MRVMERNKSAYWYLLYDRKEPVKDKEGHETGDTRVVYKEAVKRWDNVSAATGSAQVEQFGNFISYDKVIVTDDLTCPIDENTVLFMPPIRALFPATPPGTPSTGLCMVKPRKPLGPLFPFRAHMICTVLVST